MDEFWEELIKAFLHDPPDKACDIRGHQVLAKRYTSEALEREVPYRARRIWYDDIEASVAERLPMPKAGTKGELAVGLDEENKLTVIHPMSGQRRMLDVALPNTEEVKEIITNITGGIEKQQNRFLALWRLFPAKLSERKNYYLRLPADTRLPDHTIWNHVDITTGFQAAFFLKGGPAFLSFCLGPVQSFIETARTVRDLWSGSAILSWLTFQGMLPVIEELGPTAVVYPSLRGTPIMDLWLHKKMGLSAVSKPESEACKVPCIPNRFLALVPYGENGAKSSELAQKCENAVREAWSGLSDAVRENFMERLKGTHVWQTSWKKKWRKQTDSFFEIHTAILPWTGTAGKTIAELHKKATFAEAFPRANDARSLADVISLKDRPKYRQKSAGLWQARVELSARLMEARRNVRHVPPFISVRPDKLIDGHVHRYAPKCSLMGSYEQMGPESLKESKDFWDEAGDGKKGVNISGVRLRKGDRLCAVALTKRFSAPVLFLKELNLQSFDLRFPDTATVAAAKWIKEAGIDPDRIRKQYGCWSGNWLHWPRPDFDEDEDAAPGDVWRLIQDAKKTKKNDKLDAPPAYYAILKMDGDDMGLWLRGDKSPAVKDVLHPKMRAYFEEREKAKEGLEAPRPVGPALHAAISEALTNFAVHIVPSIVRNHSGTLIYSGGDDVLALLPAREALNCALKLYRAYRGEREANNGAEKGYYRSADGRELLVMGPKATLSAGIAIVHYKDDLRLCLRMAREAEKKAKDSGKDALQLTVQPRGGEQSSALCEWDMIEMMGKWMEAFEKKASDRWAYKLREEAPVLKEMPIDAVKGEIARMVNRAEKSTRERLVETDQGNAEETGTDRRGDPGDRPSSEKNAGTIIGKQYDAYVKKMLTREERIRERYGRSFQLGRSETFLEEFITLVQSASFLVRGRSGE